MDIPAENKSGRLLNDLASMWLTALLRCCLELTSRIGRIRLGCPAAPLEVCFCSELPLEAALARRQETASRTQKAESVRRFVWLREVKLSGVREVAERPAPPPSPVDLDLQRIPGVFYRLSFFFSFFCECFNLRLQKKGDKHTRIHSNPKIKCWTQI